MRRYFQNIWNFKLSDDYLHSNDIYYRVWWHIHAFYYTGRFINFRNINVTMEDDWEEGDVAFGIPEDLVISKGRMARLKMELSGLDLIGQCELCSCKDICGMSSK
jgi:hypothetical protein